MLEYRSSLTLNFICPRILPPAYVLTIGVHRLYGCCASDETVESWMMSEEQFNQQQKNAHKNSYKSIISIFFLFHA
jgi:hypothetical protein